MTTTVTTASTGPLTANGVTPIPFDFQAVSATEIRVTRNGLEADPATYTVALNANNTGSITPTASWGSDTVYIYSEPNYKQETNFARHGAWYPDQLNKPLDKHARTLLGFKDYLDRTLVAMESDSNSTLRTDLLGTEGAGLINYVAEGAFPAGSLGALLQPLNITPPAPDNTASISAAATAAGTEGALVLGSGVYSLTASPVVDGVGVLGLGTQLAGTHGIPGLTDYGAALKSAGFFSRYMVDAGSAGLATANEFAFYFSAQTAPTSSANSYQKNTVYATMYHGDPSVYASTGSSTAAAVVTTARDAVALDVQAQIAPGNMTGRLFGIDNITSYPAGSDGSGCAAEFKVVNDASSQPYFGQSTSKHGLNMFAAGAFDITSGVWLDTAESSDINAKFTYGVFITRKAVRTSAMQIRETSTGNARVYFDVSPEGRIGIETTAHATADIHILRDDAGARSNILLETPGAANQSAHVQFTKTAAVNYSAGVDSGGFFRITNGAQPDSGTKYISVLSGVGIGIGGDPQGGSQGNGAIFIANATTVPTAGAFLGGFLYVENGALKYRGGSGTITTLGAA